MSIITTIKHTRSAGGVVLNKNREVLVVNQKGTFWSLPKGHINVGEDELTAAKREIYEESGITHLELIKKLGSYQRYRIGSDGNDRTELKTIIMFLFKTDQEHLKPVDSDNPMAIWVKKNKVADLLTHKKDKKFFQSIIGTLTTVFDE